MARPAINKNLILTPENAATAVCTAYLESRRKRATDLFAGLVGIFTTLVMLPVVALLIKIDSRGSIFYRQQRLGLDGRPFELFKFRTMIQNAETNGDAVWALENDPRITRVGWVLRRLYIDEFPQWWNVVKGDMSVVGPRPERPEMSNLITQRYPKFTRRLDAKPGITGLAQTEYKYTNSVNGARRKLNYDQKYIRNASIALDLWIVMRTFRRVLLRRGT